MCRSDRLGAAFVWALLGGAGAAWAPVSVAAAEDGGIPMVRVSMETCPRAGIDAATLVTRLRVELATYGAREVRVMSPGEPEAAAPTDEARFEVAAVPCEQDGRVFEVRLVHLGTGRSVERAVDVSEVAPDVQARTLALAMAELLGATWAELSQPMEATAAAQDAGETEGGGERPGAPPASAPGETAREADAPAAPFVPVAQAVDPEAPWETNRADPATVAWRVPRAALGAAMVVRGFPSGRVAPLGGRLSLDLVPTRRMALRIAAEAGHGTALDPFGTIDLNYATAGVTAAVVAACGEHAYLTVGPRVAAGFVNARGKPSNPDTPSTSGFGALLLVGGVVEVDVRLVGALALRFGLGADAVVAGHVAYVSGVAVAGVTDGGLGAFMGLAVEL